jgi:hypothetical protein
VVEAKSEECESRANVFRTSTKEYAEKLKVDDCSRLPPVDGDLPILRWLLPKEGLVDNFHTLDELWNKAFPVIPNQ